MIDSTNPRVMADNIRHLSGESGSQASDITAQGDAIKALQEYGDETIIGTYNDTVVYRKVLAVGEVPSGDALQIEHGVINLGDVLAIYGVLDKKGATAGRTLPFTNLIYITFDSTKIYVTGASGYTSAQSGRLIFIYTKAIPSPDLVPAPDDTRTIEPEIREEAPEAEPIIEEEPVVEVKKTTRKKSTN